jgi:hypothetical protein
MASDTASGKGTDASPVQQTAPYNKKNKADNEIKESLI